MSFPNQSDHDAAEELCRRHRGSVNLLEELSPEQREKVHRITDDLSGRLARIIAAARSSGVLSEGETSAMRSILQGWVMRLGLRHQGVLVSIVRGCDSVPKEDPSKALIRALRGFLLNAHCGESVKPCSFIDIIDGAELKARMRAVRRNCDSLPHHFVMHLTHAAEILGYKHYDEHVRLYWWEFYRDMANGMHLHVESESDLDRRLNADEYTFAKQADATQGVGA